MWSPAALAQASRLAYDAVGRVLGIREWPEVPVVWNRRLRRAGRAIIDGPRGRVRKAHIELSTIYFEVYPDDLHAILVHEATHVGLALVGLPFGHGPDFRRACLAAGGRLHGRRLPGRVLRYRCPVCADVLERQRPTASSRWCARCVDTARAARQDPFLPERALVLVGVGFRGVPTAERGGATGAEPGCPPPPELPAPSGSSDHVLGGR
jgi:predicted SprT family Zn-dependent metalloprotease